VLPRFGLIIFGLLYSLRLLIVNIDLGRYGLVNLKLARPEYIMVGILGMFLSLGTLGAIQVLSEAIRHLLSSIKPISTGKVIYTGFWAAVYIFGMATILDLMFRIVSRERISLVYAFRPASVLPLAAIFLNSWALYNTFQSFKNLGKEEESLSLKSFFYATYYGFTPFFAVLQLVGMLTFYAATAYPQLAKGSVGGINLLLSFFFRLHQISHRAN
jgi:hypothetical protein